MSKISEHRRAGTDASAAMLGEAEAGDGRSPRVGQEELTKTEFMNRRAGLTSIRSLVECLGD